MGYYIEVPQNHSKAHQIVTGDAMVQVTGDPSNPLDKFNPDTKWVVAQPYEARMIDAPATFGEIPEDMALICVVDNGLFEAAAYVYCEAEFEEVTSPRDTRPRQYVLMDKATAELGSGYAAMLARRAAQS